jgi:hypothetical protein
MNASPPNSTYRGPCIIIVTTTVDQATQAHKRKSLPNLILADADEQ